MANSDRDIRDVRNTALAAEGIWRRGIDWLSDPVNLVVGSGLPAMAAGAMTFLFPLDWKTPLPWLLTVFAFAVSVQAAKGYRYAARRWNQWRRPPQYVVSPASGGRGEVEIRHRGADAEYWVDGRIVSVSAGPNPSQVMFRALPHKHGREQGERVTLRDGEWATVVLAENRRMPQGEFPGTKASPSYLCFRRGKRGEELVVPAPSAEMELHVHQSGGGTRVFLFVIAQKSPGMVDVTWKAELSPDEDVHSGGTPRTSGKRNG